MRIVAGSMRGRAIAAPNGSDTRPTTDRVREALFSSLYSLRGGFEGAIVLDAFAGSGALGIEALSRGAEHAMFYESDPKAARTVRDNLKACGLGSDRAAFAQRDVMKAPPAAAARPFDLVFLDPPYAYDPEEVVGMVARLREAGSVAAGGIIVYEHALKSGDAVASALESAGIGVKSTKKYGKTGVTTGIIPE